MDSWKCVAVLQVGSNARVPLTSAIVNSAAPAGELRPSDGASAGGSSSSKTHTKYFKFGSIANPIVPWH